MNEIDLKINFYKKGIFKKYVYTSLTYNNYNCKVTNYYYTSHGLVEALKDFEVDVEKILDILETIRKMENKILFKRYSFFNLSDYFNGNKI